MKNFNKSSQLEEYLANWNTTSPILVICERFKPLAFPSKFSSSSSSESSSNLINVTYLTTSNPKGNSISLTASKASTVFSVSTLDMKLNKLCTNFTFIGLLFSNKSWFEIKLTIEAISESSKVPLLLISTNKLTVFNFTWISTS
ncbi:hypothetical protein WICPIJ_008420 [Wickerhamomyces pijperi]|uniref:Uncharacterized protein n=1 Tax=Wickerhamomyces pijperi TaxID=599730 RepID=A0A9P8PZE3_WICPI|nr:hypothetical protein WICPIJ_008420 [Wickerhamomyces pijperi]